MFFCDQWKNTNMKKKKRKKNTNLVHSITKIFRGQKKTDFTIYM